MSEVLNCHYHQKPALWRCERCEKEFGECCVPSAPEEQDPFCVLCSSEMVYLGVANTAKPFWLKINEFFLYPLNVSALGFLLVCSLLNIVVTLFPLLWPVAIILICALTKYSLQIIDLVSEGEWRPPTLSEGFSGEGFGLFFKQLAIFFLMGLALYFIAKLNSGIIFFSALGFFLLALPASMMILAREQSVFSAVNPIRLAFVMVSIGWPYLLLYLFLIILYGAPGYFLSGQEIAGDLSGAEMLNPEITGPSPLFMGAYLFITGYFSFVMCSMMGYCLFQYQEALGYSADMEPELELDISREEYLTRKALSDSHVLFREGREAEALKCIQGALGQKLESPDLYRRYHQLLILIGKESSLLFFTQKYIRRLMIIGKEYDAADAYLAVQKRLPGYFPDEPDDRYRLALALHGKGQHRQAIRLLHNMHKLFPKYRGIPEAYLLAAKIFSESLGDDKKALQLLMFLDKRFPSSKVIQEVRELLRVLNSLVSI